MFGKNPNSGPDLGCHNPNMNINKKRRLDLQNSTKKAVNHDEVVELTPAVFENENDENNAILSNISLKRKQFRWTDVDEIVLLKEVLSIMPYTGAHGEVTARWEEVAD